MTGPEIVQFAAALNAAYSLDEVKTLLLRLDRKFTDYTTASLTFPKQLEELVGAANSQGWVGRLVSEVVHERSSNAAIRDFLVAHPDWDPAKTRPLGHPCDALRIIGGKSFIGRSTLRTFLRRMSGGPYSKNVLLVMGTGSRIGKTYTHELVTFLSINQPPSGYSYVDLDKDNYDAAKLAKAIAKGMQLDINTIPSRGEQQATRWNQELAKWLIPDNLGTARALWWIILDGVKQKTLPEEVQELIAQIAERVQSARDYRLILIDYGSKLPLAVAGFMFRETVAPLGRADVEQFLSQIHQERYGAAPDQNTLSEYVAGAYNKLAQYVRENPEMDPRDQLLLNLAVTDAVEIIREG